MPTQLEIVGHGYQPLRKLLRLDGSVTRILPEVNERIFQECYKNVLTESNFQKPGFVFSFYTSLREWMKDAHPKEFATMKENIQTMPEREYRILGDPFVHSILPLLPAADQDMMIHLGRQSFYKEFGFYPKGAWLPETAVSGQTIELLKKNGYEYTVLADYQVQDASHNPMYIDTSYGPFAVFHFHSELSGSISYQDSYSENADRSLRDTIGNNRGNILIASDMELYGHHKSFRDQYLQWMLINLNSQQYRRDGFSPLSIQDVLGRHEFQNKTKVQENSSWSCSHGNLGRWTGVGCNCDHPSAQAIQDKQRLFTTLRDQNAYINSQLDYKNSEWRKIFTQVTASLSETIYSGRDFLSPLKIMIPDEKTYQLFAAKIYTMLGQTSCGWFFPDDKSPERALPIAAIEDVGKLLSQYVSDISQREIS